MKLFRKLFRNKKASELVEKIMTTAFAIAAGAAVIAYTSNVIIESKNAGAPGIFDDMYAARNRMIGEDEGTPGLQYEAIGDTAFSISGYNGSSNDIVIPSTHEGKPVTEIKTRAFSSSYYGTSTIQTITIGSGIQTLGEAAFFNCSAMTYISIPDTCVSWGPCAFMGCSELAQSFKIPTQMTTIPTQLFQSCRKVTSFDFHSGITEIGPQAFSGVGFSSFKIPRSITYLGSQAFSNCSNLTSIYVPKEVTNIRELAFSNGTSLTIYCERSGKPGNWHYNWRGWETDPYTGQARTNLPQVVWGATLDY